MKQLPCKECISFAICKQRVKEWTDPPDMITFSRMIDCKEIRDYMFALLDNFDSVTLHKVRSFYGLPNIDKVREKTDHHIVSDTRHKSVSVIQYGKCDCNISDYNTKDCKHEIITDVYVPSPKLIA